VAGTQREAGKTKGFERQDESNGFLQNFFVERTIAKQLEPSFTARATEKLHLRPDEASRLHPILELRFPLTGAFRTLGFGRHRFPLDRVNGSVSSVL
jgi:hypothetical protein